MTDALVILIGVAWLGAFAVCVSEQPWAQNTIDRIARILAR